MVRGHIEIPIQGSDERFSWSVWCSLSRESFEHMMDHWNDEHRDEQPPYFGGLCSPRRVTAKPLPQARTEPERKVVADVQQHGWHVLKVLPEGDSPGWAYVDNSR